MKIVYSPTHSLQNPQSVIWKGVADFYHDSPSRADTIVQAVEKLNIGDLVPPEAFDRRYIEQVHCPDYLKFLQTIWNNSVAENPEHLDLFPSCFIPQGESIKPPILPTAQIGYYTFDMSAPITAGTWEAAYGSANVALTGQQWIMSGEKSAFSLCRPPGHHAGIAYCGGFCFINNAAVAAQAMREGGAERVAILDVDFHHGNGTQQIFYNRSDVMFLSIHGHPDEHYPFFTGHSREKGEGEGEGFNHNYPLRDSGPRAETWFQTLDQALDQIKRFKADALVISLGVDTYENDPISAFNLRTDDYSIMGDRLAALEVPTLIVMEGGYDVEAIDSNVINVLKAFK